MTDWQPIETAPKDGIVILGWSEYMSEPAPIRWGRKSHGRTGWQAVWDGIQVIATESDFGTEYVDPEPITHWQPLPIPPKAATP